MGNGKSRIENKSSRTAGFTCVCRAASYLSQNKNYRSGDYIAPLILPVPMKFLVKTGLINFKWPIFPRGIYEYVIARTKFIDNLCKESINEGVEQIVIFGAGFDSRAIRFGKMNENLKIYELDTDYTLQAKIGQFKKRKILLPENTVYIPVDFNIDSPPEKLLENGFKPDKRSLLILEGIIMYLTEKAVDELFGVIDRLTSTGSRIVFDYIHAAVLKRENLYYGESSIYKTVSNAGEGWRFGFEKSNVSSFLEKYNLKLIRNLDSEDLEKLYFKDENNNIIAKINGTHCIALVGK
ncbi:MAG: SAM-dependent methyltransferase [Spirochaetales bacterium]|nr:SAM-dependent methyltransferase [Spirochaetales bacterium]